MSFFTQEFLSFFIELAPNNNKDWFDLNRKRYETHVKKPFVVFVQHIISELTKIDSNFSNVEPKDCMFRINRDIRFSKDKSPYKMMMSAVVSSEGKKSKSIDGIYFELGPEHVRVYGGVYEADKEDLNKIRTGISENLTEFQKLYQDEHFVSTFGSILGEKNKVLAKELKDSAINETLLYNKQWYFYAQFEPEKILEENFDQLILDCYKVARPIEQFFNRFIQA